eukprot:scaffold1228_cov246-Pinguiococcus_pyrenoidosus.AAC.17
MEEVFTRAIPPTGQLGAAHGPPAPAPVHTYAPRGHQPVPPPHPHHQMVGSRPNPNDWNASGSLVGDRSSAAFQLSETQSGAEGLQKRTKYPIHLLSCTIRASTLSRGAPLLYAPLNPPADSLGNDLVARLVRESMPELVAVHVVEQINRLVPGRDEAQELLRAFGFAHGVGVGVDHQNRRLDQLRLIHGFVHGAQVLRRRPRAEGTIVGQGVHLEIAMELWERRALRLASNGHVHQRQQNAVERLLLDALHAQHGAEQHRAVQPRAPAGRHVRRDAAAEGRAQENHRNAGGLVLNLAEHVLEIVHDVGEALEEDLQPGADALRGAVALMVHAHDLDVPAIEELGPAVGVEHVSVRGMAELEPRVRVDAVRHHHNGPRPPHRPRVHRELEALAVGEEGGLGAAAQGHEKRGVSPESSAASAFRFPPSRVQVFRTRISRDRLRGWCLHRSRRSWQTCQDHWARSAAFGADR